MMEPIDIVTGIAIPFGQRNVDTDIIIPARFLKTISRAGLGKGAFTAIRSDPDNIFDQPRHKNAPILIAGDNFGCGSSREHAPWALADLGIRIVIAPSFADIFASNAFKNSILLVTLPQEQIDRLMEVAADSEITVDLSEQMVTTEYQDRFAFEIDPFRKECLLGGLDEIGLTEAKGDAIAVYEAKLLQEQPWLNRNFAA
jgi:3-isopropylmalate/(R)-2-methylmalate dehydratase small subunit